MHAYFCFAFAKPTLTEPVFHLSAILIQIFIDNDDSNSSFLMGTIVMYDAFYMPI